MALLLIALAGLQVVSSALLRDYAEPASIVALIPASVTRWIQDRDELAPTASLRLLLARRALAEHDEAVAKRLVAQLPPTRDRWQLEAQLAEVRGDHGAAVAGYLRARDLIGLEREESRIAASGHTREAVLLQRQIVKALESDPTQPDALAEAWWRLGLAEQLDGYMHYPINSRRSWALRAMRAYEQACALAPLSERYLVAAGNQEINLNDDADAEHYFERARDVDPTSAQAWVGLAQIAMRRGDPKAAHRYMLRARHMEGSSPTAAGLSDELQQ